MRKQRQSESRRERQLAYIFCIFTFIKTFSSTVNSLLSLRSAPLLTLKPSPYHALFSSPIPLSRVARPPRSSFSLCFHRRPLSSSYSSIKVFVSSRGWCSHHHRSIPFSRRPLSTGFASPLSLDETSKTRRLRIQSKTSRGVRVFASSPRLRISGFSYLFFVVVGKPRIGNSSLLFSVLDSLKSLSFFCGER